MGMGTDVTRNRLLSTEQREVIDVYIQISSLGNEVSNNSGTTKTDRLIDSKMLQNRIYRSAKPGDYLIPVTIKPSVSTSKMLESKMLLDTLFMLRDIKVRINASIIDSNIVISTISEVGIYCAIGSISEHSERPS
jgi:hypothetical protein